MDKKSYVIFGIPISLNALIVLVSGTILCIVIMFIYPPYTVFLGIYAFLIILLLSYNINCVIVGHCKVWAWFLTIFYVIYFTLAVLYLYMFRTKLVPIAKVVGRASKK